MSGFFPSPQDSWRCYVTAAVPVILSRLRCCYCRYSLAFEEYSDFIKHACMYKVVVFATFPEHHLDLSNTLADKACPGQQMMLVVHNPSGLESSGEYPTTL